MTEINREIIICPHCKGLGDYIPTECEQRMKETKDILLGRNPQRIEEEKPCRYCGGSGRVVRVVEDRKMEEAK